MRRAGDQGWSPRACAQQGLHSAMPRARERGEARSAKQCLIEAQPPNATPDPDIDGAVLLLRSAIQSQDITEALSGALGLIHFSDFRDNQSIIDLTHRTAMTTKMVREALSYSCSPNAARTLKLMREQAPNPEVQARIDANIERAEQQRHEDCHANH